MSKKIGIPYKEDGDSVIKMSTTELQQNLKAAVNLLETGTYIVLTKHRRKVCMLVPY